MNWTHKGDLVRTIRTVTVENAPVVRSGRVTLATDSVAFHLLDTGHASPEVTYMILQGHLLTGPESRSGGTIALTYSPTDCPDWAADIMREVC